MIFAIPIYNLNFPAPDKSIKIQYKTLSLQIQNQTLEYA